MQFLKIDRQEEEFQNVNIRPGGDFVFTKIIQVIHPLIHRKLLQDTHRHINIHTYIHTYIYVCIVKPDYKQYIDVVIHQYILARARFAHRVKHVRGGPNGFWSPRISSVH